MDTAAWANGSLAGSRTSFWRRAQYAACCRIEALQKDRHPKQSHFTEARDADPRHSLSNVQLPRNDGVGQRRRAATLAAGLGAHLSGLAFELDIHLPVGLYARPPEIGGILAAERRKSAANARDLVAAFDAVCARRCDGPRRHV